MQPQLLTSKSEHWCTPQEVLDLVYQMGPVELDPCSNIHSLVQSKTIYTMEDDGLAQPWGNGLVFVNPPYGRSIRKWTQKMIFEGSYSGSEIVGLLPARTDTAWFHELMRYANSAVLWRGRLAFIDGTDGSTKSTATFPSMLVYFGPRVDLFEKVFGVAGLVLKC